MKLQQAARLHLVLALVPLIVLTSVGSMEARASSPTNGGTLDGTFDFDGKVNTPMGTGLWNRVSDVLVQPDGKIVATGEAHNGTDFDIAVARYEPDGSLDETFSDDGKVFTPIGTGDQRPTGAALQPDAKILVALDSWVVRYETDGSLDETFDGDGILASPIQAVAVAAQADGRILIGGSGVDFVVARLLDSGALDTSFGGDGIATASVTAGSEGVTALAVMPNGKVVAAGNTSDPFDPNFALARFNANGSIDASFSGDGVLTTEVTSAYDRLDAIALQPDNGIVVSGQGFTQAAVVKYLPNGSPDVGFDADGVLLVSWGEGGSSVAAGVAVQSDGKIVAGGTAQGEFGDGEDLALYRVNPDGSPDIGFGDDGFVGTDVQGNHDRGFGLALQPDGKIVLAGETYVADYEFALARYHPESVTGLGVAADFNGDGLSDLAVGVPWEDQASATDTGAVSVLYATDGGLTDGGNQFWDQTSTGSATNGSLDGFGFASVSGDFDGDGFADLAVGVPLKTVFGGDFAGAVSVLYGSSTGLGADRSQQWNQDSEGVEDAAAPEDYFGWSLASGDFNGDGFDDLAAGVPGETVGGDDFAGAVNVLYGSGTGLTSDGDQIWNQDSSGINNGAEPSDQFGLSVGTGDFDGNGFADLAVGVPTENLEDRADTGGVSVIYGSATGLSSSGDDFWHQGVEGVNNSLEADDWFGYRVTGGDFDGDGFDDLLSGIPAENFSGAANAGAVSVIFGSASGLDAAGDEFWHQDRDGINDTTEAGDEFGISVAAGDFDGDGYDDAAIGVVGELVSGEDAAGGVSVIYGTSGGLDDPNDDFWKQNSTDIEDSPEELDLFGYAVMAANFGNGPEDDLAIGVVLESVGSVEFAGAVNVIYGSPSDLTATGDQLWSQDSTDILDTAEFDDEFGFGLAQRGGGGSLGPRRPSRFVQAPVA
jgi:uncharacterized delta-60 repeat protein